MKAFVTGVDGQLGHDVMEELTRRGHEAVGSDLLPPALPLDITDGAAVQRIIGQVRPDVVIHCAAWTAVDAAEEPENREKVFAINEGGTRHMAEACRQVNAKLIYISTDYVFDGQGERPWQPEDPADAPLNVYGQSKRAGERAVEELLERCFIVRIAWAFGQNGRNFVKTMLSVGRAHDTVRVVNDQFGTPTYTRDLARLLADMAETEKYGRYHVTNTGGYISWYEFTREIYRQAGMETHVIPVTTEEYGLSRAARPRNSRLDQEKLRRMGFEPLPPWQDALGRYLKEMQKE